LKSANCRYSFHDDFTKIMPKLDILYVTRMQKERFDPTEFKRVSEQMILRTEHLSTAKDNLKVLHPLPRVKEIDVAVDNTKHAYYFQQAANGVPVRQALLSLILNEEI